ncbi:MAG: hypothetical protein MK085_06255 [Phycisphaerales bacterium]|nr:hypothetical protein [Phycisphaerales bacterium]
MKILTTIGATVVISTATTAFAGSSFDTGLTDLGGGQYQLQDTFTINYNLMTAYLDLDQNGTVDDIVDNSGEPWATPSYDAFYSDPEHYVLSLGSSDVYFMGNMMNIEGDVDWTLSYTSVAGDASTMYSTILFGTADIDKGSGIATLNIRDGLEWPVSGGSDKFPLRAGIAINDFDSFSYNVFNDTLAANVVPGPLGLMALAGFGLAGRRRNR